MPILTRKIKYEPKKEIRFEINAKMTDDNGSYTFDRMIERVTGGIESYIYATDRMLAIMRKIYAENCTEITIKPLVYDENLGKTTEVEKTKEEVMKEYAGVLLQNITNLWTRQINNEEETTAYRYTGIIKVLEEIRRIEEIATEEYND